MAGAQTHGRGRHGRQWFSPSGSVYLSYIHRFNLPVASVSGFGLDAALAVAEVLEGLGIDARLKWPNDVHVEGKKIAGLLAELVEGTADSSHCTVIIGIGLNVQTKTEDWPPELRECATSVGAHTELKQDIQTLGRELTKRLARRAAEFEQRKGPDLDAYTQRSQMIGRQISYTEEGQQRSGHVIAFDADGALRLRDASGERSIRSGEVHLVG